MNALQNELWTSKTGAVSINNYQKVFVRSAELDVQFKNDSNAIEFLYLYTCVPRHDTSSSMGTCFGDLQNQKSSSSSSDASASTPGMTPFQSSTFTSHWIVKDVKRIALRPGEVHCHHQVYHINRMLDSSLITIGTTTQFLRDYFSGILCVVCGSPVGGNSGTATFSQTSVLVTIQGRWHVQYTPPNVPVSYILDDNQLVPSTGNTDMNVTSGLLDAFQNIA